MKEVNGRIGGQERSTPRLPRSALGFDRGPARVHHQSGFYPSAEKQQEYWDLASDLQKEARLTRKQILVAVLTARRWRSVPGRVYSRAI